MMKLIYSSIDIRPSQNQQRVTFIFDRMRFVNRCLIESSESTFIKATVSSTNKNFNNQLFIGLRLPTTENEVVSLNQCL